MNHFKKYLALFLVLVLTLSFVGCSAQKEEGSVGGGGGADTSEAETTEKKDDDSIVWRFSEERTNYVRINTKGYGTMIVELYPDIAPQTVENFQNLVEDGFYTKLTFHRIVKDFVVQGGDPLGTGLGGSDTKVFGEFSANGFENTLSHTRGVLSMARRGDDYNSASSQFFICHQDVSDWLDGEYAAFGKVIEGLETIDKLAEVPVFGEEPLDPPQILSIRFVYPD
ncbi:MAG: peptidylprolyl isomerase [Clostridia bacterium]|nr:peptidylprolyl isomerase [Clostridia bacterium]